MFSLILLLFCCQLSSIETTKDFEIRYTVALSSSTLAENVEEAAVPEVTVKPIRPSTTLVTTVSKVENPEQDYTDQSSPTEPAAGKETIATNQQTLKSFISTTVLPIGFPDQDPVITKRGLAQFLDPEETMINDPTEETASTVVTSTGTFKSKMQLLGNKNLEYHAIKKSIGTVTVRVRVTHR